MSQRWCWTFVWVLTTVFWPPPFAPTKHWANIFESGRSSWFLMLVTLSITSLFAFLFSFYQQYHLVGSLSFCFTGQHANDGGTLSKLLFHLLTWNCCNFLVVMTSNCLFDHSCLRLWCSNDFCAFLTFYELLRKRWNLCMRSVSHGGVDEKEWVETSEKERKQARTSENKQERVKNERAVSREPKRQWNGLTKIGNVASSAFGVLNLPSFWGRLLCDEWSAISSMWSTITEIIRNRNIVRRCL